MKSLDLIEAEARALDCARLNVTDPRAAFHWADVTVASKTAFDAIVMNPPFHTGRAADPSLGIAFIRSAAAALTPQGRLWMVANRHLPYEETLSKCFRDVSQVAVDAGFKVFQASRPLRGR